MSTQTIKAPDRLRIPLYTYAEADRLVGVGRGTSRRWLKGYKYNPRPGMQIIQPPITPGGQSARAVTFIDLIETVAANELRKLGFGIRTVRKINEYCAEVLDTDRPLVTEQFKTDGRAIFVKAEESYLLEVLRNRGAQAWDEVLDPFLTTVDYEAELARRWWPMGKAYPVVLDPYFGYGIPTLAEAGVRTEILAERYGVGETIDEIASDFEITAYQVQAALEYEHASAA